MDFEKRLSRLKKTKRTDPIEIFSALPKSAGRGYLREAQASALKAWHDQRQERNNLVRMNTGAGKTLVNLLILQSLVNEGLGSALYLCPNHQLVEQTLVDADNFNIAAVGDGAGGELPNAFVSGDAIYVTTVHKLFNGLTKFGRREDSCQEVGSILFDDAHACVRAIRDQCTIKLPRDHEAYLEILKLFHADLEQQGDVALHTIEKTDSETNGLILRVPYWAVERLRKPLLEILHSYREEEAVLFPLPLIDRQILQWEVRVSGRRLEITPATLNLGVLPTFSLCQRIVFSSATLGDPDGLILELGLPKEAIDNAIEPETTWDVGERLILMPQLVDPAQTREQFGSKLIKLARREGVNCVVLVPSNDVLRKWLELGAIGTEQSDEVPGVIEALFKQKGITAVLSNRYDGVDLPDDACRILILDGVPRGDSLRNIMRARELGLGKITKASIAQKIEQGMGRGVRSVEDYCVTVILDPHLTRFLADKRNLSLFGPATEAQIDMGLTLTMDSSKEGQPDEVLMEAIEQVLTRDKGWRRLFREQMIEVESRTADDDVSAVASAVREAYDLDRTGQPLNAMKKLESVHPNLVKRDNAWILQVEAQFAFGVDNDKSSKLQLKAYEKNDNLLKPPKGVEFVKMEEASGSQASRLIDAMGDCLAGNAVILRFDAVLSAINFKSNFDDFEQSLADLFEALGLLADRPDKKTKKGPDVLVRTESSHALLIEAKNESSSPVIPKKAFQQLAEDADWYEQSYRDGKELLFLVAHESAIPDPAAAPKHGTRVITPRSLDKLGDAVRKLSSALAGWTSAQLGPENVAKELKRNGLTLPELATLMSQPLGVR